MRDQILVSSKRLPHLHRSNCSCVISMRCRCRIIRNPWCWTNQRYPLKAMDWFMAILQTLTQALFWIITRIVSASWQIWLKTTPNTSRCPFLEYMMDTMALQGRTICEITIILCSFRMKPFLLTWKLHFAALSIDLTLALARTPVLTAIHQQCLLQL